MVGENTKGNIEESEDVPYKLKTEVIGDVKTTFTFKNMCDFQYLPTERVTANAADTEKDKYGDNQEPVLHRPILSKVHYGDCLPDAEWLASPKEESPLFLPPAAFTRMDQPQDYHFRKDTSSQAAKSNLSVPQTIIGRTRQRRTLHAIFVNYEATKVPEVPSDVALHQLKVKFIDDSVQMEVKDAFRRQPIWTKTGLSGETGQSLDRLKYLLPTVAYYFTSGPWRNQWVRFGYDPRKDPESSIYQTLDYRVRLEGGAKLKVRAKRSYANYILPYQSTNPSKSKTSTIIRESLVGPDQGHLAGDGTADLTENEKAIKRSNYMFEEGVIPPCRQMFYQYKDVKLEEAKKLVSTKKRKLTAESGECDERNGWYEPGVDTALREMMTRCITRHLTSNVKHDQKTLDQDSGAIETLSDNIAETEEYFAGGDEIIDNENVEDIDEDDNED